MAGTGWKSGYPVTKPGEELLKKGDSFFLMEKKLHNTFKFLLKHAKTLTDIFKVPAACEDDLS